METQLVAPAMVLHVEDESAHDLLLAIRLRARALRHYRVSLLSEAVGHIYDEDVAGFIIDLRLPHESVDLTGIFKTYDATAFGLIQRIRSERPEVPVVVLTNYWRDADVFELQRRHLVESEDIFRKMDLADGPVMERLIARLRRRPGEAARGAVGERGALEPVSVPADLDPRLQRLLERQQRGYRPRASASIADDEVAVLAKVNDLERWEARDEIREGVTIPLPSGREWIVTGRVPLDRVEVVCRLPFVQSLSPAQRLRPALRTIVSELFRKHPPPPLGESGGKDVLIGVVDQGCDFVHRNFRREDGTTRLLALWDQRGTPNDTAPQNIGALHRAAAIDAALATEDPHGALKHILDYQHDWHGTHVMDIAAGGGRGTGRAGVAPAADLLFVELSSSDLPWQGEKVAEVSLGDSVHLVEAARFVFSQAGERPCVLNLSLGTNGGPHDGSTLVEESLDSLVQERANRAVVIAAGNSFDDRIHAMGKVAQSEYVDLAFEIPPLATSHAELEVWYHQGDELAAELIDPSGKSLGTVSFGGQPMRQLRPEDGTTAVLLVNVSANASKALNQDNTIVAFLEVGAAPGTWTLRLHGRVVKDGSFHAWIERDDSHSCRFQPPLDNTHTLGSISCGRESIVVGAYNPDKKKRGCTHFSSSGPTRDGRNKPEACAPGSNVEAACAGTLDGFRRQSGTSMAAAAVTGVIALMLSEAYRRGVSLSSSQLRQILQQASHWESRSGKWDRRLGWGAIDAEAALRAVAKLKTPKRKENQGSKPK
ncbi:MAG TPA: S8 family serine peptidase [Thermoanaerobaculia bacterium]|nr:S8 family serine peptidase [Thermoanaerobaculia bacterium]